MKTRNKIGGFELIEFMIIVVIIGTLAAMAIPAFQRVRFRSIEQCIARGQRVDADQMKFYNLHKKDWGMVTVKANNDSVSSLHIESCGELTVNGETYILVKKTN